MDAIKLQPPEGVAKSTFSTHLQAPWISQSLTPAQGIPEQSSMQTCLGQGFTKKVGHFKPLTVNESINLATTND